MTPKSRKESLGKATDEMLEALARRFGALSEVNRLKIVKALQCGEKSVTAIVKATGISQSNVSRHLQVLTSAGLIGRRKVGLNVLYRVTDETLNDICSAVCESVSCCARDLAKKL